MNQIIDGLELLNIKNSVNVARELYTDFFHLGIYNYFKKKPVQMGGGDGYVKFGVENTHFKFYKVDRGDSVIYSLHQNDDDLKMPECIVIIVDKIEKIAILHNISYFDECFSKDNKKYFKSCKTLLLKIAIKFVNELRRHYKINSFQLKDNSKKYCNGTSINFALMHTFLYGDTWYGKRGFRPRNNKKYEVDEYLVDRYEQNIKIINTLKTKDTKNLKKYLKESYKKISPKNISFNKIKKIYYDNCDNSLSEFFKAYLKDFDKTCTMFDMFMERLAEDNKIFNFDGKSFIFIY